MEQHSSNTRFYGENLRHSLVVSAKHFRINLTPCVKFIENFISESENYNSNTHIA